MEEMNQDELQTTPDNLTIKPKSHRGFRYICNRNYKRGTDLGMTHLIHNKDIFRTPLGGFLNHSDEPNCQE